MEPVWREIARDAAAATGAVVAQLLLLRTVGEDGDPAALRDALFSAAVAGPTSRGEPAAASRLDPATLDDAALALLRTGSRARHWTGPCPRALAASLPKRSGGFHQLFMVLAHRGPAAGLLRLLLPACR